MPITTAGCTPVGDRGMLGPSPSILGTAGFSNVAKPETELMGGQTTSGTYLPCMADLQAQQVWEKAFIFLLSTLSYKSC